MELPNHDYDQTHVWQNSTDRVMWQRSFELDGITEKKMAIALLFADPNTPEDVIADRLTVQSIPPRFGYDSTPLEISDCFSVDLGHVNDYQPTNFSGSQSEIGSSFYPSLNYW